MNEEKGGPILELLLNPHAEDCMVALTEDGYGHGVFCSWCITYKRILLETVRELIGKGGPKWTSILIN